ncbi:ABC transporter permease [Zhihengliuella salsuginis]|uniref:Sulfate ABC transporter permease n=1 Tax=Zhihengliuella salsuginis TaxID=578222 RepID=A0ABQ3GE66_9MICC|nr:ABC transporter permease [Zhihengliuella salsuginis]GHD01863.1 sulfate ABC transporter permease [Zhihengliuella salsuginis]
MSTLIDERSRTGPDPEGAIAPPARSSASRPRRGALARAWSKAAPPLAAVVVLVSLWQIAAWASPMRDDLFPGPGAVLATAGRVVGDGTLPSAAATSLWRGLSGFAVALVIATPLALALAHAPWLRRAVGPLVSALQVLPSVAWVPAAIIVFGLTDATIYAVILLGAIPSIVNGLLAGIDMIPGQYRALSHVLGARRLQHILLVELPAALPGYVSGLRQGWAFSWRSLMAAELIAVGGSLGLGVGSLLQRGRDLADLGLVALIILVILAIGIVVELLVFAPWERRLLAGRGLSPKGADA